jgi:hypothetical protein
VAKGTPARLPLRTGVPTSIDEYRKERRLTPLEQRELDRKRAAMGALGLDPDDPLTGSVDEVVAAVLAEDAATNTLDPSQPPVEIDLAKVPDVKAMSDEQKARALAKFAEMNRLEAELRSKAEAAASGVLAKPGFADVLEAAESGPVAEAAAPDRNDVISNPEPPSTTGADGKSPVCPRCRFDLNDRTLHDIPIGDRRMWVAALETGRYRKDFKIPGVGAWVRFRTLTSTESNLVHRQAASERAETIFEHMALVKKYELALSVEEVAAASGRRYVMPADSLLKGSTPGQPTPLPGMYEYLMKNVLPSESMARLVFDKFSRFRAEVEWMEANADNENFPEETSGSP